MLPSIYQCTHYILNWTIPGKGCIHSYPTILASYPPQFDANPVYIPRSGLKLPKIPILAAPVTSMQFWRHFLWRVPKPDNSYGGMRKNRQSWWPMNSMHRWCKPAPKIWELRCNSMQWRFFLHHLPCHLPLSLRRICSNKLKPRIQPNPTWPWIQPKQPKCEMQPNPTCHSVK